MNIIYETVEDLFAAPEGGQLQFKEAKSSFCFTEAVKICCALSNCGAISDAPKSARRVTFVHGSFERLLYRRRLELMLKSGYKLTENKVAHKGDFYYINNELVIALAKMTPAVAAEIIELLQPGNVRKVITLDRLFANNDELKTNTALQMRDAGVEFRVV
jgi:uncharacterized RmlC-like cupin family protein